VGVKPPNTPMTQASPQPSPQMTATLALRVVLPFALGYFLSYLYRAVNAVIAPDLVQDLGLQAGTLGLMTAAYFLTFAAIQLPLGILLDRYGPKRVEAVLLIFAAIGAALFAWADTLQSLVLARALIGFGVSACLMASFKAYVMWFPLERLPLVNGVQLAAGGLGALAATAPVEALLGFTDWRGVFWILAAITAIAAVLIFTIVPNKDAGDRHASLKDALGGVIHIFKSPLFWRVAPWTVAAQATFLAVQSLWVGPWFMDVLGLDPHAAALNLFWIAAAMVAGYLSWGVVADRLHKISDVRPMRVAGIGMGVFWISQVFITTEWAVTLDATWPGAALAAWVIFGFSGTSGLLPYAALSQAFPSKLAGRVNTGLNLVVFVIAFIVQWAVGAIIDLWPAATEGGYGREGYQAAFAILLALQALGIAWYVWKRRIRI